MSDEDLKIFIEDFCDFLNGLEASIVKLRSQIDKLCGSKWKWNPDKIKWEKAEGFKGEYERYPLEGEKPEATSDYKNLLEDLKKHNGKLSRNGFFYWLFEDLATIGRKKRERKA